MSARGGRRSWSLGDTNFVQTKFGQILFSRFGGRGGGVRGPGGPGRVGPGGAPKGWGPEFVGAAPGLHMTAREPKRAHVGAPAFRNTTEIQREDPQEREERMQIVAEKGQSAKFGRRAVLGVRAVRVVGAARVGALWVAWWNSKVGFGQTWFWPNLVLAKLGFGQTWFGQSWPWTWSLWGRHRSSVVHSFHLPSASPAARQQRTRNPSPTSDSKESVPVSVQGGERWGGSRWPSELSETKSAQRSQPFKKKYGWPRLGDDNPDATPLKVVQKKAQEQSRVRPFRRVHRTFRRGKMAQDDMFSQKHNCPRLSRIS